MDWSSIGSMVGSMGSSGGGGGGSGNRVGADPTSDTAWLNTYYQAGKNRQDQVEDAQRMMTFQKDMYSNRYQMQVKDMIAAGLNPMLAVSQGAPGAPSGAMPGQPPDPGVGAKALSELRSSAAAASMAQTARDKVDAETDLLRAQAEEVRSKKDVNVATLPQIQQSIEESRTRITELLARASSHSASAAEAEQRVKNLREQIPQIRSTVELLRSQTQETLQRAGLHEAQAKEVYQRIRQDLPQLARDLDELEIKSRTLSQSGEAQQAVIDDSYVGTLSRVMKALNPLQGFVGTVPMSTSHRRVR